MKLPTRLHDYVTGKSPTLTQHSRSTHWPTVRKHFLEKNPECAVCGGTTKIEVHHIHAFHTHPELELEITNLISLCESWDNGIQCHLAIGHLGSYKAINIEVIKDAKAWKEKIKNRMSGIDKNL